MKAQSEIQIVKPLDVLHLTQQLRRKDSAHKGHAGKVLLIGGAPSMAGALVMAGQSALFSGAGWVQLMILDAKSAHMCPTAPELMVHVAEHWQPGDALVAIHPDVVAIGPGLGMTQMALTWLNACLTWHGPLILDADALNFIAQSSQLLELLKCRSSPSCITPHPGEAARLLTCTSQDIQSHREKSLSALIKLTHAVVVLKGHHTLVGSAQHDSVQCMAGNSGMAVSGMGDVLTGCVAALVAQGVHHQLDIWQSTCLAVQLHSMAGDRLLATGKGPIGMRASELAEQIRLLMNAQLA